MMYFFSILYIYINISKTVPKKKKKKRNGEKDNLESLKR